MPSPGRPWNPPYQPGPGTDDKQAEEWAAGAGIEWVLENDEDTIDYAFPNGITADAILNNDFKMRNIPIAMMLLDWNHWLPDVHPLDGLPRLTGVGVPVVVDGVLVDNVPIEVFEAGLYRHYGGAPVEAGPGIPSQLSVRDQFVNATHAERCALGEAQFDRLAVDLKQMLGVVPRFREGDIVTPDLLGEGRIVNSMARWFLVKRFELHQEFGLEDCGSGTGESRSWFGTLADTVPSVTGMSDEGAPNYDPRAPNMANQYASGAWWTVQAIHNTAPDGNCNVALPWQPYLIDGFSQAGKSSGEVMVGRMLAMYTVAFRDVARREGGGVSMCASTGWEPTARGRVTWLGIGFFARWERIWSPEGERIEYLEGFDGRDPALVRHSHAQILGAYIDAFVRVSLEHPPEEYGTINEADSSNFQWPVADRDYAGCSWDLCFTEPNYVNLHGELIPEPVIAGGTFEKWSFAVDLAAMLSDARALFVELETRQALGDLAASIFPNIDWQSLVDDLGPRATVNLTSFDMLPPVDVYVDPGAYAGSWWAPGSDPYGHFVGPMTLPMAPGKNQIVVDGYGEIHVLVYPDGLVVPFDAVQATGGQQTVVFANASVSIDANGWEGHWGFFEQEFAPREDLQMVLVPGLDYTLQIGVPNYVSFRVEGPDAISTTSPASLAIDGTTVTFRTAPITFEPGDYEGWYGFEYGPSTAVDGGTEYLVTGFTYPMGIGGFGGSIALTIAEDGTPSVPAGAPMTVVGQSVWFEPQFLTVTTEAPLWHFWGGLFHSGTQTIGIMPGATYMFDGLPNQLVAVDEACIASPAAFTQDGHAFSLGCASEDPARPVWYADLDGDGFGDPSSARSGTEGRPWETQTAGDCDDASGEVNPASTEVAGDGVDADCSGGSDWDLDGDGHTAPGAPDGTQDDCDDTDAGVFAGNVELCDGRPNGCQPDGTPIDEAGTATWFPTVGNPLDVTTQLAGAPGAPLAYAFATSGELALCDGTFHATLSVLSPVSVTIRSLGGAEATVISPEGKNRGLLIDHAGASVTVEGLTFTNGVAPTYAANGDNDRNGGGISVRSGVLTVRDSVFEGNTASNSGGGIFAGNRGPTLEVYDSVIRDNTIGGLVAETGSAWIERTTFEGNDHYGISAAAPTTVVDSTIASTAGGADPAGILASSADLIRVTITGTEGTGVITGGGLITLTDSEVSFNTTGLYALGGGAIELTDSLVSDNTRWGAYIRQGGAVTCHGDVGLTAGFLRNIWGAASIDGHAASSFTSHLCDFGASEPWHEIFLDSGPRYTYGDDVSFVCTSTECL